MFFLQALSWAILIPVWFAACIVVIGGLLHLFGKLGIPRSFLTVLTVLGYIFSVFSLWPATRFWSLSNHIEFLSLPPIQIFTDVVRVCLFLLFLYLLFKLCDSALDLRNLLVALFFLALAIYLLFHIWEFSGFVVQEPILMAVGLALWIASLQSTVNELNATLADRLQSTTCETNDNSKQVTA